MFKRTNHVLESAEANSTNHALKSWYVLCERQSLPYSIGFYSFDTTQGVLDSMEANNNINHVHVLESMEANDTYTNTHTKKGQILQKGGSFYLHDGNKSKLHVWLWEDSKGLEEGFLKTVSKLFFYQF